MKRIISRQPTLYPVVFFIFLSVFALTGCSLPTLGSSDATATPNITQAYQTVNAKLTESVAQTPIASLQLTNTRTSTPDQTPTSAGVTPTRTATRIAQTPSPRCNIAAPGVPIDVTIPDDTQMAPGQPFTKTWKLQNIGECTWTKDYGLVLFSGEPMSAPARVTLSQDVAPGNSVEISVDLIAPQLAGSYQGNWKLSDHAGNEFGIGPNGDAPFWVRIEVVASLTQTLTVTPSTPTATATPGIQASGMVNLLPGDRMVLDTGSVNSGGEDVSYENVAQGVHQLKTLGTALLGVYGDSKPDFTNCMATSPSAIFLNVEALAPGTYLCYRTGTGLLGRAQIISFSPGDAALTLDILTWTQP